MRALVLIMAGALILLAGCASTPSPGTARLIRTLASVQAGRTLTIWEPESDWDRREQAAEQVHWLNVGEQWKPLTPTRAALASITARAWAGGVAIFG
jgi:hypothetical protein